MDVRGIGDAYALRRLLWLLVGTVILPTVLLSLFGVMAIRNQRAALQQQLERERAAQLEIGARALQDEVEAFEAAALRRARACQGPLPGCSLDVPAASASWAWASDHSVPSALQGRGAEQAPEGFSWLGGETPLGLVRSPERIVAWELSPGMLLERTRSRTEQELAEDTRLLLDAPTTSGTAMEEAIARLSEAARDTLALPPPLSGWRLRIEDRRPAAAALQRNAWLYPLSLVLLVALVLFGAVLTLGTASREIRLSRLQTDFVSSVSHELRTPLTSIRMFVETLQSGRLQDQARVQECLELLSWETERLSRMIERTLDWARMEAGRRVYSFEPASPRALADAALQALRSQNLLRDDATIRIDVPESLPDVLVDEDAIVEALLNLLQNAVRYTPPPRDIVLSASQERGGVAMTVSDNGPGVPKPERRRIFEKFYQVDARLSAPSQGSFSRGSGLGLAIVRAVARAHGGQVRLDSEEGSGSRFTVWLPGVRRAG